VGNHTWCNAGWEKCPVPSDGKEAVDRKTIYLEQEELIKQVYRINPNTIVALISSFPYAITWTQHTIPAIVQMTHNSQEEGTALADVLFGDYNPGGRLVQTWPRSMEQLPPMMDYNIRNGRTYMYFKGEPLYPFGYGLSYTSFTWSGFKTSGRVLSAGKELICSIDIANTGKILGDEVVQLYIRHVHSTVERPKKELKAFQRVTLLPGQKKTILLKIKAADLQYWDENTHRFVLENDKINLMAGSSSADIKFQETVDIVK